LWQIHHIDNYGEGSALLVRIHHCIADGISLVRVLLSLTDDNAEGNVTPMHNVSAAPVIDPPWWQTRISSAVRAIGAARQRLEQVVDQSWGKVRRDPSYLMYLGREAYRVGSECLSLGLRPADPETRLKGD